MTRPFRLSAMGGGGPATYIEDVFSTYLYRGNSSGQTITNSIDLSTKGGMVWLKSRSSSTDHTLYYTDAGVRKYLKTNTVDAQATWSSGYGLTAFNADGFTIGNDTSVENTSNVNYASWTFRKQAKFFDVVTWTGDGTNNRQISHALGSTPGCIIVKELNQTGSWFVYHTSNGTGKYIRLNSTDAVTTASAYFPAVSSTTFTPTSDTQLNTSTVTYVAYLFAHNAGGFGATGNDNVITCGSYTGNGSTDGPSISLGWEPQWLMIKRTDYNSGSTGWYMSDDLRGMPANPGVSGQYTNYLIANHTTSENNYSFAQQYVSPTATGFTLTSSQGDVNASGGTYIYVAIRRPHKVPTSGTQVYKPIAFTGVGSTTDVDFGFPIDAYLHMARSGASRTNLSGYEWPLFTRLLGVRNAINTTQTSAWGGGWGDSYLSIQNNFGVRFIDTYYLNYPAGLYSLHGFKRAPGFMDVVAYAGTGSDRTVAHGLGVTPELMIVKRRNDVENWYVYHAALGATKRLKLNLTDAEQTALFPWNNTAPTSTVFSLAGSVTGNGAGDTYVWYGFASCPGVSKVGSYTGNGGSLGSNGGSQTINCGFTSGARFIMIKNTSRADHWYVYDSARGIISGDDPYLRINAINAEGTSDNIDPISSGFIVNQTANLDLNVTGDTYIYLAIS